MKIKVDCRAEIFELQAGTGLRLLDVLQNADIPVNAACGGAGTCSKCRVRIREGFVGISKADRQAFSESELSSGWRLSCQARVRTHLECLVPDVENFNAKPRLIIHDKSLSCKKANLVCDLGSTGVVVSIGNEKGEALIEAHLLNRQVRFGADVMSRLKVAQDQGMAPLKEKLVETLELCVNALKDAAPELFEKARAGGLYCSGNSAMVSFLHGWDIGSLAVYPFQPLIKDAVNSESSRLGLTLKTLPLLAGFVGADTFAGLFYLDSLKPKEPWMLVDIGTNTEIVLNNGQGEVYFSSAPAGPAFEGGNIVQGMRAEAGAISHAFYRNNAWTLETIGHDKARGICGSGLIDIIFEGVKAGLISQDGFLPHGRLEVDDGIYLVADDIREFQLAKSATRTACDLLVNRAKVNVDSIFLAGTFAQHLREDAVKGTGLLSSESHLKVLGNSSLLGTLLYAAAPEAKRLDFQATLLKQGRPVELALQNDFQDAFVKNLNF